MKTLELPERLYASLEQSAAKEGFPSVADLLAAHYQRADLADRRRWFEEIYRMREELKTEYGVQPDCVPLIREDRDR